MTLAFFVSSFIVCVAPGPGVLYTLATGLALGARGSVVAAFGCTLGIVPNVLAAILGLAAILHASAVAFSVFKYVGVAYLLYLAWANLRDGGGVDLEKPSGPRSDFDIVAKGVLLNILNPKLSIFFMAFLPQFLSADELHPILRMLTLSGVFMAMTFVIFVGYGLFAASVRDHVIARPRVLAWIRRSFAGAFLALGAKLAFSER